MADNGMPWLRPGTGHDGAARFFASLTGIVFRSFEPRLLLAADDVVVALIDLSFVVKSTGFKQFRERIRRGPTPWPTRLPRRVASICGRPKE